MKPFMVGIAGSSCAGKSEISSLVAEHFKSDSAVIPLDSYYTDLSPIDIEEREKRNFDIPEALDFALLHEQVKKLSNGEGVELPVWQYDMHVRSADTNHIEAAKVTVVEGIFALYWEEIRKLLDIKVFVDVDEDTALARRLERDTTVRGSSREYALRQFRDEVSPMYNEFVKPTKRYADLLLDGTDSLQKSAARLIAEIENSLSR